MHFADFSKNEDARLCVTAIFDPSSIRPRLFAWGVPVEIQNIGSHEERLQDTQVDLAQVVEGNVTEEVLGELAYRIHSQEKTIQRLIEQLQELDKAPAGGDGSS